MTVNELAKLVGAEVIGDGSAEITAVGTLENSGPGQVSFLSNQKYTNQLATTRAAAVFVSAKTEPVKNTTLLRSADPYYAFMQATVALHGHRKHPFAGIHADAHVDPSATVGEGSIIYPGAYIGPRAKLGKDCIIYPNATIYDDSILGDRVIVHSGTVVGVDGYGYATHKGVHHKIPQNGNVIIEDDVEIGANCSIERAAIGSTFIGRGTKIDQLVVVGHGCKIGEHCLLVAQCGIAGSVTLGHHVVLAGQSGVSGHLKLGNQVTVAAQAGVINDVDDGETIIGSPAMPVKHGRRVLIMFTQLPAIVDRIKQLEQQVADLSGPDDGAEVV